MSVSLEMPQVLRISRRSLSCRLIFPYPASLVFTQFSEGPVASARTSGMIPTLTLKMEEDILITSAGDDPSPPAAVDGRAWAYWCPPPASIDRLGHLDIPHGINIVPRRLSAVRGLCLIGSPHPVIGPICMFEGCTRSVSTTHSR